MRRGATKKVQLECVFVCWPFLCHFFYRVIVVFVFARMVCGRANAYVICLLFPPLLLYCSDVGSVDESSV